MAKRRAQLLLPPFSGHGKWISPAKAGILRFAANKKPFCNSAKRIKTPSPLKDRGKLSLLPPIL